MNPEKKKSEYEDYTERLIPIRVSITKKYGNITYVFDIDGFRGSETGQIYYKGKDVLEIEQFLKLNNVIRAQTINGIGLVLSFETPQTLTGSATSMSNLSRTKSGKTINFYQAWV